MCTGLGIENEAVEFDFDRHYPVSGQQQMTFFLVKFFETLYFLRYLMIRPWTMDIIGGILAGFNNKDLQGKVYPTFYKIFYFEPLKWIDQ